MSNPMHCCTPFDTNVVCVSEYNLVLSNGKSINLWHDYGAMCLVEACLNQLDFCFVLLQPSTFTVSFLNHIWYNHIACVANIRLKRSVEALIWQEIGKRINNIKMMILVKTCFIEAWWWLILNINFRAHLNLMAINVTAQSLVRKLLTLCLLLVWHQQRPVKMCTAFVQW